MPFLYHSTRGEAPELDFRGVTMTGLASDGGLYLPSTWPSFSRDEIAAMKGLSYTETAVRVMSRFVAPSVDEALLRTLVEKAYASFETQEVAPLVPFGDHHWILELFHGPTIAFKDVALQLLGHLFEHFLSESGERMTVLGATSGDTGSAAIMALANRKNVETVILYPEGRPSAIQRKQMTCVDAPNVHALAINGTFDDGQAIVKELFNDHAFRAKHHLAAINSINWARLLAQMVYYFYAALRVGGPEKPVTFVVPTGNFGNVFAAYAAKKSGLPIARLVVASNSNDILPRFFATGKMQIGAVAKTLSPSMDIQISSNFERFLFDLCQGDSAEVKVKMAALKENGCFEVSPAQLSQAREVFAAFAVSNEKTIETIKSVYQKTGIVLDPHTAVGVTATECAGSDLSGPIVNLACAAPAKFPEIIHEALNLTPPVPDFINHILQKPERTTILDANSGAVRSFIENL